MSFDAHDHRCMAEALRLAARGLHSTHPNPRVGCVIAAGGQVVGRGWHATAGGRHAEIAALEDAGERARGATAYVTLEPCNYHGRTGPCTEALIEAGVTRVVSATRDPNPRVDGAGHRRLADAGVRAECGLLAAGAEALNAGFFKRMTSGRPWVRVKLAQSLDGRTALAGGESQWITGADARRDVQDWRARAAAVLTGVETILADDPLLNVRDIDTARQPLRVIADSRWRTPAGARTLGLPGRVLIAGLGERDIPAELASSGADLLPLPGRSGRVDLGALMAELAGLEVNEVQVEAGETLCGALLEAQMVDEILVYQAPVLLGSNGRGPFAFGPLAGMREKVELQWLESGWVGGDLRLRLQPVYGRSEACSPV
jgi:diaminohydroxyphosphoribosylaminopyrimidine deaminase/5-amino-6-(5-phosphoribosylamino)uracil reductase